MSLAALVLDPTVLLPLAAAGHVLVLFANLPALRLAGIPKGISPAAPFVRQVFWVHYAWIAIVIAGFAAFDVAAVGAIARGDPLARGVAGVIALLWATRLAAQLCVYDKALRKAHPVADVVCTVGFAGLTLVHAFAAAGLLGAAS
jgi:hypothetical protein